MSNYALAALLREQAKERREREEEDGKSSMFGFLRGLDPSFDDRSKPGLGIKSNDPLYNIANMLREMSGVQTEGEQISGLRDKVLATGDPQMALLFKAMNQKNASKDRIQALVTLANQKRAAQNAAIAVKSEARSVKSEAREEELHLGKMKQKEIDATVWSMIRKIPKDATTQKLLEVREEIEKKYPSAEKPITHFDKVIQQSRKDEFRVHIKTFFPTDEEGKVDFSGVELEDAQNAVRQAQIQFPFVDHDALIKLKEDKEGRVASKLTANLNPTSPLQDLEAVYKTLREKKLGDTPAAKRLNEWIEQKSGQNAEIKYLQHKDNLASVNSLNMGAREVATASMVLQRKLNDEGVVYPLTDISDRERLEQEKDIETAYNDVFYYMNKALSAVVEDTSAFNRLWVHGPELRTLPETLLNLQYWGERYPGDKKGELKGVFWVGGKIDRPLLLQAVQGLVGITDSAGVPVFNLSQKLQNLPNGAMESIDDKDERIRHFSFLLNVLADAGLLSENVKIRGENNETLIWSPSWSTQ